MEKTPHDNKDVEENKTLAAIGYVGILCFVPLLLKKDSKFAQFHAKQGLILLILEVLGFIPVIGWALFVIAVVFSLLGIINAMDGKYWKMPFFHQFGSKLNLK